MKITLLTAGKIKHGFYADAQTEYENRLKNLCEYNRIEIAEEKLTKKTNTDVAKKKETERFLEKIPNNALLICLDETGKEYTAHDFADFIKKTEESTRPVIFCIGGANGLSEGILQRAEQKIALGKMTLTQDLARVVFLEHLFRAFAINKNLPFHR